MTKSRRRKAALKAYHAKRRLRNSQRDQLMGIAASTLDPLNLILKGLVSRWVHRAATGEKIIGENPATTLLEDLGCALKDAKQLIETAEEMTKP